MPSSPKPPPLHSTDVRQRRVALHARADRASRIATPSQVAYIRGRQKRWTEPELADLWTSAVQDTHNRGSGSNHLYVHVPFCKSICSFCNYDRLKPSTPHALKDWLTRVMASIQVLGPATEGLEFHSLYFGGGTPSVLPSRMLRTVFEALDQSFTWHPRASRSIELDPAVMNAAKAQSMMDHGFQRYSFGVQTLESSMNSAHNRGPQSEDTVRRCLDLLPASFLGSVAVDLLLGLDGGSPERTLRDVQRLLSHPRRPIIDLFHLTPTATYVEAHFGGSIDRAREELARYDDQFDTQLDALAKQYSYTIQRRESGHCRTLEPANVMERFQPMRWAMHVRQYGIDAWRVARRRMSGRPVHIPPLGLLSYNQIMTARTGPLNLLGLGPSARTQIFGRASVSTHPSAGGSGPTTYHGQSMTAVDELRRFVVFQIRDQKFVEDAQLADLFGQTLADALPEAVAVWAENGFARPTEGGWTFASLPPREMGLNLLWSIPETDLLYYIKRRMGGPSKRHPDPH
ncbi:MAG: hypothetical protein CL927_11875 [Deltaproteobacteria bacterium]|nr:hypothetical protein [Deltaproteobacteria bacterium]HCH62231.1 hypothetical protein [Deltaproteobacteria bacterium]